MSSSAAQEIAPTSEVVASTGRRIGAYVIDMTPFALIGAVTGIITLSIGFGTVTTLDEMAAAASKILIVQAITSLLMFAWWIVITILQGGRGSVGQRLCAIRLVDVGTGRRIGFWRAVWRNIVFAASCLILVGYFTPLFDPDHRRGWHDKASGSMMVDSKAAAAAAVPAPVVAAPVANPFLAPPAGASFGPEPLVAPAPPAPASFAPTSPVPASFAPASAGAPAAPAIPVAHSGMISAVPGVRHSDDLPPAEPVRVPTVPAKAPAAPAGDDNLDATRTMLRGETRPAAIVALTWDDGTRISVHGRTLFGRNPERQDGAAALPVRDETLSLSKTHFAIDGDQEAAFVTDLHSTNGTDLVRSGVREKLAAGVRVPLWPGDRLEFGDRYATVARP